MRCKYCNRKLPNKKFVLSKSCIWCNYTYRRKINIIAKNKKKPKYLFSKIIEVINGFRGKKNFEGKVIKKIKRLLK